MSRAKPVYVDPAPLAKYVIWAIWVQIAVTIVALASDAIEYRFLSAMNDGLLSETALTGHAAASDMRQAMVALVDAAAMIGAAFLVLWWIYRADRNLHSHNVPDLQFSPAWCVGWFFVPIANLWKPYQALKEIWMWSMDPARRLVERTALLPVWWTLHIISDAAAASSWRLGMLDTGTNSMVASSGFAIVSETASIPEALVLMMLIRQITKAQSSLPVFDDGSGDFDVARA